MPAKTVPMTLLAEMAPGDVGDMFLLMTVKEAATTRDGRPYFKVAFRDAGREVSFPIWEDAAFSSACRDEWEVGAFYKVRARYVETNFGPQLEIEKIRPVQPADERDGFDPLMCTPQSRFDPEEMVAELVGLVRRHVTDAALSVSPGPRAVGGPSGSVFEISGRLAQPPRLRSRPPGTHAQRHPLVRVPGPEVR